MIRNSGFSSSWELKAFEYYLRTGRRLAPLEEAKFNPYHDPANGRFAFAPGGGAGKRTPATQTTTRSGTIRREVASTQAKPEASQRRSTQTQYSEVGALSGRHETHNIRNPGAVSTGKDDPGGVSYGSYQLSGRLGMAKAFVESPEAKRWATKFHGLTPETAAFSAQWKRVAASDPDGLQAAQDAFIGRANYRRAVDNVRKATGIDLSAQSNAVRQVTFSVAVQHGRADIVLRDAVRRLDRRMKRTDAGYQKALIHAIYDRRTEYVAALRRTAMKDGRFGDARSFGNVIKNRYPAERADALRLLHER